MSGSSFEAFLGEGILVNADFSRHAKFTAPEFTPPSCQELRLNVLSMPRIQHNASLELSDGGGEREATYRRVWECGWPEATMEWAGSPRLLVLSWDHLKDCSARYCINKELSGAE